MLAILSFVPFLVRSLAFVDWRKSRPYASEVNRRSVILYLTGFHSKLLQFKVPDQLQD
jgi:hypothetical protein